MTQPRRELGPVTKTIIGLMVIITAPVWIPLVIVFSLLCFVIELAHDAGELLCERFDGNEDKS